MTPGDYIVTEISYNEWQVWLEHSEERHYTVSKGQHGGRQAQTKWSCSCPHHHYRRAVCKHIQLVQAKGGWNA